MFNLIVNDTWQYLEPLILLTFLSELFEKELFDHLTVCKQMAEV